MFLKLMLILFLNKIKKKQFFHINWPMINFFYLINYKYIKIINFTIIKSININIFKKLNLINFKINNFFSKKIKIFKNDSIRNKKLIFFKNFKYKKYFFFIKKKLFKKITLKKKITSNFNMFFNKNKQKLNKNWNFLIGLPILFFFWTYKKYFYNFKNNLNINFKNNFNFINKKIKKQYQTTLQKKKTKLKKIKLIFLNNYNYFKKINLNYKIFLYNIKYLNWNSNLKLLSDNNFISKPYLFLNNKTKFLKKNNYYHKYYWIYNFFKKFEKFFKKIWYNNNNNNNNNNFWLKYWFKKNTNISENINESIDLKKDKFYFLDFILKNNKKLWNNNNNNFFFLETLEKKKNYEKLKLKLKYKKNINNNVLILNDKYLNFIKIKNFNFIKIKKKFILFSEKKKKTCFILKNKLIKNFNNNVYKKLNKIFYINFYKINFLSKPNGFIFLSEKFFNYKLKNKYLNFLKKSHYSFLLKNEIHKKIIKDFFKQQLLSLNETEINFKKNKKNVQNLIFNKIKNNNFFLPIKIKNTNLISLFFNWFDYNFFFNKKNQKINQLKRIKFKPGYMKIWRNSREVFKKSLDLKYKYQHNLTKFLLKYKKYIKLKLSLVLEMNLLNIIIKSYVIYYKNFIINFIKNGLIFVNGFICKNINFQIFVNDFIQFIVNIKYYIIFKILTNYLLKKKLKIKKKINNKVSNFDTLNFNKKKQKSNTLPNWLLFEKNIENDVSKFLEIDFFSLSIFIIYEPFLINDLNYYNLFEIKYGIINLYNWKYIT